MPKMLALMAVQRHTAASRSARPLRRAQHGVTGGVPTTRWTKSFNKSAHTPSFRVSLGQLGWGGGGLQLGWGGGGHCGLGIGEQGTLCAPAKVKTTMLRMRRRAMFAEHLEAISKHTSSTVDVASKVFSFVCVFSGEYGKVELSFYRWKWRCVKLKTK